MQRYLDIDGDQNVEEYDIGPDYIRIEQVY